MGSEPTPEAFIFALVEVFREVWRVLRHDGTCWLNLGDSYARVSMGDAKPKDLMMMPSRVALALRADGWWLRSDIIWAKNNPMPESTTDRPTSAHEHVYLLAKQDTYFFDPDAIQEPTAGTAHARGKGTHPKSNNKRGIKQNSSFSAAVTGLVATRNSRNVWSDTLEPAHEHILLLTKQDVYFYDHEAIKERAESQTKSGNGFKRHERKTMTNEDGSVRGNEVPWSDLGGTRNARNVWFINSAPFKGAHFATFPPELARRCIAAGTSECGACGYCGAPFRRLVEKGAPDLELQRRSGADAVGNYTGQSVKDHDAAGVQNASDVKRRILAGMVERRTVGWEPTCKCDDAYPVPCVVLDPFLGAGTTGLVAQRLGRDCIGIELNPQSVTLAADRIRGEGGMVAC